MSPEVTYVYRTAANKVAFFKDRFIPKRFKYREPGGTSIKACDLPKLLYRLPELLRAKRNAQIFIAEGEKDCDALAALGLVATCNYDGAGKGKWQSAYNRHFRRRHVVILPDNDRAGRIHAEEIASSLVSVAESVKLVELPGLPAKGDVSDWLATGGTAHDLVELSQTASPWHQRIELQRPDDRFTDNWNLRRIVETVLNLKLAPPEKLILIAIRAKITRPRPTQQTIAAAVGLSTDRVKKILANLRSKGTISISKRGRENVYWIRGKSTP